MGGICGKPSSAIKDSEESPKQRQLTKKANELRDARAVSTKRDENLGLKNRSQNSDARIGSIDRKSSGSRRVRDDYYERDRDREICESVNNFPGLGRVNKSVEGEQVSAGWPTWLVNVAGEAIRGWIPRKADTFQKLDKIGQGTYSSVYKGRDLINNKIVALKKVRFDNMDPESVKFMAREILLLRRLNHPNIIKLEALITSRTSSSLYLVFEYMEHDLTGLTSLPGVKFTEPQIKCYMQQLLSGLDHCHSHGVLHRDIKGSNLLISDEGILKIADFGLASYFNSSNRQGAQLTSRVVTLWYRPPELLLGATQYGVAVDLWSSGCILGELYTGKPIMPGRTEVEQLHKIFKLCGSPSEDYWRKLKLPHSSAFKPIHPYRRRIADAFRDVPDVAIQFMELLLSIDPVGRGTAATALDHEFFTTEPVACDPSSLPKYLPSKEMDAKLREEEAKRQGSSVAAEHRAQNESLRSKGLRAPHVPDPNAELAREIQRRQSYKHHKEDSASNFSVVPQRDLTESMKDHEPNPRERIYNSGPLVPGKNWTVSGRKNPTDLSSISKRSDLSGFSDLAASRTLLSSSDKSAMIPSHVDTSHNQMGKVSGSYGVSARIQEQKHRARDFAGSRDIDYGRVSMKDHVVDGRDRRDREIQFSGPLLAPSSNIEQLLREHDRRIQEVGRRLRKESTRSSGRVRPQDSHPSSNRLYVSSKNMG